MTRPRGDKLSATPPEYAHVPLGGHVYRIPAWCWAGMKHRARTYALEKHVAAISSATSDANCLMRKCCPNREKR